MAVIYIKSLLHWKFNKIRRTLYSIIGSLNALLGFELRGNGFRVGYNIKLNLSGVKISLMYLIYLNYKFKSSLNYFKYL